MIPIQKRIIFSALYVTAAILVIRQGWIAFLGLANPYPVYFEGSVSEIRLDGHLVNVDSGQGLNLNPTGSYVLEYTFGSKKHRVEIRPDISPPNDSPTLIINKEGVTGSPAFKIIY